MPTPSTAVIADQPDDDAMFAAAAAVAAMANAADPTMSVLIRALEKAWSRIRLSHPEIPEVVIIVASGVEGSKLTKYGHYSYSRWVTDAGTRPEVLLAGEALDRPPLEVFGTLLHEAAHGLADVRQIKDTSRNGRYHNEKYKQIAEYMGMDVSKDEGGLYGWCRTVVGPMAQADYAGVIEGITVALAGMVRRKPVDKADKKKGRSTPRAECGCGRKIRVAPAVLANGPIFCGCCGTAFNMADDSTGAANTDADTEGDGE